MTTYYSPLADKMLVDNPRTIVNPYEYSGQVRSIASTMTLTTDHDDGDIIIMMPIPSNMALRELLFSTDGTATQGTLDISVYTLDTSSGSDVFTNANADLFASAQAIASALNRTDVLGESTEVTIAERYLPLWQVVDPTATENPIPGQYYWLGVEIETADVDGAGTVIALEANGVV